MVLALLWAAGNSRNIRSSCFNPASWLLVNSGALTLNLFSKCDGTQVNKVSRSCCCFMVLCLRSFTPFFPPPKYFEWKLEWVGGLKRITAKGQLSKTIHYILWSWMQSSKNKFALPVGSWLWVGVFGGLQSADIWQDNYVKDCFISSSSKWGVQRCGLCLCCRISNRERKLEVYLHERDRQISCHVTNLELVCFVPRD